MKKISSRDGLVELDIPDDWLEDRSQPDMDMFFVPGDKSRTFRISMMELNPPADLKGDAAREALRPTLEDSGSDIEVLGEGRYLCTYDKDTWDRLTRLSMRFWFVSWLRADGKIALAHFNYTRLRRQKSDTETSGFVEMLNQSIRRASYNT